MGEIFPVLAGVLLGLLISRIPVARARWIGATVLTVLAGVAATFLSGEAAESWAFVLVDIGLVAIVTAITWGLATLVTRRLAHPR